MWRPATSPSLLNQAASATSKEPRVKRDRHPHLTSRAVCRTTPHPIHPPTPHARCYRCERWLWICHVYRTHVVRQPHAILTRLRPAPTNVHNKHESYNMLMLDSLVY